MYKFISVCFAAFTIFQTAVAQPQRNVDRIPKDPIIEAIIKEATENSMLEKLAHELMDGVGPRLVGSPKMLQAHDWAVVKYNSWNIDARNEKWGEWRGWDRGITHIDMVSPWVKSLAGMQLAWSPNTKGKTISGDVILLPTITDSVSFQKWLPTAKGKFVLVSMNQPTGRPDFNWEEFGTDSSFAKMKRERDAMTAAFNANLRKSGYTNAQLFKALEDAGAACIIQSNWSRWSGANKIFSTQTKVCPVIDVQLEDYGLIYRLAESGNPVKLNVRADNKETGTAPALNTVAEIKSTKNPAEYIMLSAHFDSWDGGTGATDNGTGTIVMMEAMRILKKVYPNPNRTILVGHWGSEEQGLNGSRAFVEDHPEIVNNLQALFNQDNGTGRVVNISGQGFLHAYDFIGRWLSKVPAAYKDKLETSFPGNPGGGGSDYASFVAAGAPGFSLSSLSWSYGSYTWHTNVDTYDKIVFDDVRNNVILAAILAYQASEDAQRFNRDKAVMPTNPATGQQQRWPEKRSPTRKGGMN